MHHTFDREDASFFRDRAATDQISLAGAQGKPRRETVRRDEVMRNAQEVEPKGAQWRENAPLSGMPVGITQSKR